MFKASRWRSDKNKITAVFKFQFHATQVSEFGGNGMVISIVPAENGKPTAKLEKCVIKENCCYWENSVYETVKFIQDVKSGKIYERIYYFIISNGLPKGSLVGEFSVNIADYLEATKGCSISFPFKKSLSNSHLHVSIQRIQENANQRVLVANEIRKSAVGDKSLRQHFSDGDIQDGVKTNAIEEEPLRRTMSPLPGLSGTHRGSSGSDITLSSSDSSSGLNSPRRLGNGNANKDNALNGSGYQDPQRTRWDLAIVPVNGLSTDFSLNSPRDGFSSNRSQIGMDEPVEQLKADLVALSRRAEVTEIELQTLRKQIMKESKKGQDLLKEISCLKEERDTLKDEFEKLKTSPQFTDNLKVRNKLRSEEDPWTLLDEIREELNHEKDLSANLRLQLQKTQESNSELLLAVQDLEEMSKTNSSSQRPNRQTDESLPNCPSDDEEQKALEELVRQHSDAQETYILEQKVMDLCSELEMYRRDKDDLEMQMEQLALDYEILKQENHEYSSRLEQSYLQAQRKMPYETSSSYATTVELEAQREKLQNELNEQSKELSRCFATIKVLEARKEELEKQVEGLKADKEAVARSQIKHEQRAVRAEAALSQSSATINELEAEIQKLRTELKKQLEELSGCFSTIHELETLKYNLEDQLEKQAREFEAVTEELANAKMEQEQRALQAVETIARHDATINELESNIKKLENELKIRSEESNNTAAKFKELEAHIHDLEEELEIQAEGFEDDLEAITIAKVEQEKRAIRAEEALRLLQLRNSSSALRIQDEFKRLSSEMQSSLKASGKLATQAMAEAGELRLQNRQLQDMLQKANEELQSAQHDYEIKLQELSFEIDMKSTILEQKVMEFKEKSEQFENNVIHTNELEELRSEVQRLTSENTMLAEQAKQEEKLKLELEYMKVLIKDRDLLVHGENSDGENLEGGNAVILEVLTDEDDQVDVNLRSEVETLRAQCNKLKHSLFEDELEKEKLRKQVFQLKADLKKKDELLSSIEKKSKENNGQVLAQGRSRTSSKNTKLESVQRGCKEVGAKEVATMKEKIKLLEEHIKSKEAALETSANAFLAKEKNLHGKIEDLEYKLGEVRQYSPRSIQDHVEEKISVGIQSDYVAEEAISDGDISEASTSSENLNNNDSRVTTFGDEKNFDILLKEMVSMKEQNKSMEIELKEMQERYSEISLKFAEVEGERQKLVMSLRSFKNAKKS